MKTIGQIIHNKTLPLVIDDDEDNLIYYEDEEGHLIVEKYLNDNPPNK